VFDIIAYASFVAKLVQFHQPTQYIISLIIDDVSSLLAVGIFALVDQVFVNREYA
jgi:hypothetical protein